MDGFQLPKIESLVKQIDDETNSKSKTNNKKETKPSKTLYLKNDLTDFENRLKKILEIKIYLKLNFHIAEINENFMSNLGELYATNYLEKMGLTSNSFNIKKLLQFKPIENCDFQLSLETQKGKNIKVLHIFPNNMNKKNKKNLANVLTNEEFEKTINKGNVVKQTNEDLIKNIKNKVTTKDELQLFNPQIVENLFNEANEIAQDKKLYLESKGLIEQQVKGFDLSIENIRKKYLIPSKHTVLKNNDELSGKAKFKNFEKIKKNEIVNNPNFQFPFLEIDLNRDVLKEISKPIDVPIEVLMKDVLYILDNFPIDSLISLDEPMNKKKSDEYFNNMYKNIENEYKKSMEVNEYYKIKTITKKDVVSVYKKIQTPEVYRIIGLLINLIYWIIFGYLNRVQVDKYTKNFMLNKILGELTVLSETFTNKTLYHKLFMPLFILVIRIECEALFTNKFKKFLSTEKNVKLALEKVNELITTIFDPNSYFSTFIFISSDKKSNSGGLTKNKLLPNYKKKINATSNLINQLFSTFKNEKNIIKKMRGEDIKPTDDIFDHAEWEEEKEYILQNKVAFYRILLDKINNNLKKRNLDPIFKVASEVKRIKNKIQPINEIDDVPEQVINENVNDNENINIQEND